MKGVRATSWVSPLVPGDGDPRHGINGYTNLGCRCELCRAANTAANSSGRKARAARMARGEVNPPHGVESTYFNYMCRCNKCRRAHSVAQAARNRRRKDRLRT